MWRWLHSLPRAVRQQFHSPGASAGICVEDLHENELNKREPRERKACVYHCRYRYEKKNDNGEKKGPNPENIDFWKLLHGKHSAFEAIGLSGAIALCVELTHYNFGKFRHSEEDPNNGCLLKKFASTLHKYGGSSFCPINRIQSGETRNECSTSSDKEVATSDTEQTERYPTDGKAEASDPIQFFSDINPSPKSFKEEKGFIFYDFQTSAFPRKFEASPKENYDNETSSTPKEENKSINADTQVPVLSIEEAFSEFEEICRKYTSIGKGIMGTQAAIRGNLKSAAALWEEATSLGHSKSCFNLALCYEQGIGVEKNMAEAIRLYQLAVKENHSQAMYNLALLYIEGTTHTPQNTKEGIRLMTAAAGLGLVQAQRYLGVYYSEEQSEDTEKAVHFLKMAANQQDPDSQYYLAMFYEHGYGVDKNACKAAYLYNKAAESEHPDAMYNLSLYHLDGIGGLPQDRHSAKSLLKKSAELGNQQAKLKLKELEQQDTASIKTDEDKYHTLRKKSTTDLAYLMKLNTSVSTPCLSDLVCDSFKQMKDQLVYNPVSDAGTVSQIFTQLMVPRGMTLVPSMSKLSDISDSTLDESDSDSGVLFTLGKHVNAGTLNFSDELEDDIVKFEDPEENDEVNYKFSHSVSMPDMMIMACM